MPKKKGHWQVVGYDGAGEPIRKRRSFTATGTNPPRDENTLINEANERKALRKQQRFENRVIREVLAVNVR